MIESVTGVNSPFSTDALSGTVTKTSSSASAAAQGAGTGTSFAEVMGDMASEAANALKLSETKSFETIQGKATTREVIDAVMSAERSLQTAIAIRDKVVTAYLEVARMQI